MFNRQIQPLPHTNAVTTYSLAPYKRRTRIMRMISSLTVCLVGAGLAVVVIDGQSILLSALTSLKTLS